MPKFNLLLPTTLVGSYPQPDWLIDREMLSHGVARVRTPQLWRVAPEWLERAQDDATIVAIHDLERAGLDIITDGEIRRESYSNKFANALAGVDGHKEGALKLVHAGQTRSIPVPLFSGPARRMRPVEVRDIAFLRAHTDRRIKITLPGPFTMSEQSDPGCYASREALAMDLAVAVNDEVKDLFAAGADVVQIDEPWMQRFPDRARQYGVAMVNRALEGITPAMGTTALHLCFGYAAVVPEKPSSYSFLTELEESVVEQISIETAQPKLDLSVLRGLPSKKIVLGVLDLGDPSIETSDTVAKRIEGALKFVAPERLVIAPDCGMKYLPREVAFGKLQAMVAGASMVRAKL
ncbi:5-methyltetrahydropteroyltriglutamate--homocysteine methyltransferase [Candidatus Binatus sp.]|uniref:5-methyltetrahydropteroyltriglutamate-- homocysteine methyltransferase n=1 Tax=Candidatus Binatus sp. TaxID=2811406 RepID=UPI003BAEF4F5